MSFEEYSISTGEPSGTQPKIWNGELMTYQRQLLNNLYKEKNPKEIEKKIRELIKTTYHIENEMRKASFYKEEFDAFAKFLKSFGILHTTDVTEDFLDDKGVTHKHIVAEKRSLVSSIPELRPMLKGQ